MSISYIYNNRSTRYVHRMWFFFLNVDIGYVIVHAQILWQINY
jgi:hypothetical protein